MSTKFCVEDKTKFYHQSNLVYFGKYFNQTCIEDYLGVTDLRIKKRIIDHNKRDKNSLVLKQSLEEDHNETKISKYWVTNIVQLSNGRLVKHYS